MRAHRLTLFDMNDRELLALMHDLRDSENVCETHDIVITLWPGVDGEPLKKLMRCVGIRLAWMRRFGVIEQVRKQHWRLTSVGEEILLATIKGAQSRLINDTADTALPVLLAEIGQRYNGAGYTTQRIARREFVFATGRRD